MKIVFLTNHYPSPPDYGAAKRVYHLCKLLGQLGEVSLVVLKKKGCEKNDRAEKTMADFKSVSVLYVDQIPTKGLKDKFCRLFLLKQVWCRHGSISERDRAKLNKLISKSDLVWCHTLKAADMTGMYDFGCSVLDLDDLNSDKHFLEARSGKNHKKFRKYWQSLIWQRWERHALQRFTAVTVCSEDDRYKMRNAENVFTVPNGFDIPENIWTFKKIEDKVIGFVGILRYQPNIEAVLWFVEEIFPLIQKEEPTVRFRIAGKLDTKGIGIHNANVDLLGFVKDLDSELKQWDVMVVPLKVGGGTRLKILEAFSKQVPVVSTSLGAYGIGAKHNQHLLLANDPPYFADQCLRVIRDRSLGKTLAHNAYQLYNMTYTWEKISLDVKKVVDYLMLSKKNKSI